MGAAAEGRRPHRYGCWRERSERPPLFLVCAVVFYVSARLCGTERVLDDVRREAHAGQRTRKARSQVLPCKPRYSAYACWLRKDLQEKSTFPKKTLFLRVWAIISHNDLINGAEK